MSTRYTQLFLLPQNLYSEAAPILIEAGALLKDSQTNNVLAQLKYKNLQEKCIKALNIRIQPLDVLGNPLGDVISFQYLDLSVNCGEVFGSKTPIHLPDNTTRGFSVEVCSVVFDDNSAWETADASWEKLEEPIRFNNGANKELQKQYQSLYGTSASYQLQEMKDLWQCVCGAIHKNTTSTCNVCHNSLAELRRFDINRLEEECAQRLEAEAKADTVKRKKKRTLAIVMSSIVTIAVVIALLWYPVIQPPIKYNKAVALMDAEKYKQAIGIWKEIEGYKDAIEQKIKCYQYLGDHKTVIKDYGYTEYTILDGVTGIGELAFCDCTGLTSITIPDSVTSIGYKAFYGCTGLANITIPDSVTSIGNYAFYGCTGLTNITIPDSVTSIGNYAFWGCDGLTSIIIPDSVTSIGYDAFYGCDGLTSIIIPDSVTSIGHNAFTGCKELTSITIPGSVKSIGYDAFADCKKLTSLTISGSGTSICNGPFCGWKGLTSITISDGVTSIDNQAFYGCSGLVGITIPDSVTSIGDYAFSGCSSLMSITIPDSVTSIGKWAFLNCDRLRSIKYRGTEAQWNAISKGTKWIDGTISCTITYDYIGE